MTFRTILCVSLISLVGCVSFKELKPNPEIISSEGPYHFLKNKDDNFALKKDEKYFIKFPKSPQNDFYLILVGTSKTFIHSYLRNFFDAEAETLLTRSFGFKEGGIQQIPDENPQSDSVTIYPIDSLSTYYSWLIDTVKENMELVLRYRYVQQWRYTFENEYDKFQPTWASNVVDRTVYNAINADYQTDGIDYGNSIALVTPKKNILQSLGEKLKKIEQVFPPDIKKSNDTAYAVYVSFCVQVDDELTFQKNYLEVLTTLKKEKETRNNIVAFLKATPEFIKFLTENKQCPPRIIDKVKKVLSTRFDEILPYYEETLKGNDINAIGPSPELDNVEPLLMACDEQMPDDFQNLIPFVHKFSEERDAMSTVEVNLANLNSMVETLSDRPSESFYRTALSVLEQTQNILPESEARHIEKYGKFKCAMMLDQKINNATKFVEGLTEELNALQVLDSKLQEINTAFERTATWPSDSFYTAILVNIEEIKNSLPNSIPGRIDPYGDSKIAQWANKRLANANKQMNDLQQRYQKAEEIVPQINTYKAQGNFRNIIRLLNVNRSLGFLLAQYPDVDSLSLGNQTKMISSCLNLNTWNVAESKIDELFHDKDYLNLDAIAEQKNQSVKQFETELFQKVNLASRSGAESFVKNNETTFKNISSLYKDSAFLPVYKLTFSSTSLKDVQQKRKQIEDYLSEMKNIRFPETAIKALYKELTKNVRDQGVEKARAVVDHGKFYKGSDKQVKGLVDECDYTVPKIITKPSEYRKLFVLPSTSNKKGNNDYLLRLNLQIPSEAEFPVFDVNITVPPELAQNDEKKSWFDEITINKKQIKNEGRFHITAPTSSNNYESQITPVQLDKGNANIFEIKFKYSGFKVFEVSVMTQKPIIRKN